VSAPISNHATVYQDHRYCVQLPSACLAPTNNRSVFGYRLSVVQLASGGAKDQEQSLLGALALVSLELAEPLALLVVPLRFSVSWLHLSKIILHNPKLQYLTPDPFTVNAD
jgi:hypothetical protein